jgi:hypothetical protein
MAYNDITGDAISTRFGSKEAQEKFDQSFDTIFGEKKKKTNGGWTPPPLPLNEYPDQDWPEERIDVIGQNGNVGYGE